MYTIVGHQASYAESMVPVYAFTQSLQHFKEVSFLVPTSPTCRMELSGSHRLAKVHFLKSDVAMAAVSAGALTSLQRY